MKKVGFLAVVAGIALILVAASPGTFPIYKGFLQSDLNGNNFGITNLSYVSSQAYTNKGVLGAAIVGTDSGGKLIDNSSGALVGLNVLTNDWSAAAPKIFITNQVTLNTLESSLITNHGNLWQESGSVFEDRATFLLSGHIYLNATAPFGYVYQNGLGVSTLIMQSSGANYGKIQNDGADMWSLSYSPTLSSVLGTPVLTWQANNTVIVNSNLFSTNITAQLSITNRGLLSAVVYDDANGGEQAATSAQIQTAIGGQVLTNDWSAAAPNILLSNQLYIASLTNNTTLAKNLFADYDISGESATPSFTNSYLQLGGREFGVGTPRAITFGYHLFSDSFPAAAIAFSETSSANHTKGRITFWTRDVTTDTAPSQRATVEPDGTVIVSGNLAAGTGITNSGLLSALVFDDANGKETAATSGNVQTVIGGLVLTNDWAAANAAILLSNNVAVDNSHFLTGNISALTITNGAGAGSRMQLTDSNKKIIDAAASGAVPIDADGSATTAAQISALVTINQSGFTNNVTSQSANYNVASTDWLVLLTGAHTATLPTAVGIPGKSFIIKCSSAGTNAILTTSSQTIDGAAKWTNTASLKFTWVISDGANWRVIGQN